MRGEGERGGKQGRGKSEREGCRVSSGRARGMREKGGEGTKRGHKFDGALDAAFKSACLWRWPKNGGTVITQSLIGIFAWFSEILCTTR